MSEASVVQDTETLEKELRELSEQLDLGRKKFDAVHAELKARRDLRGNDQPQPDGQPRRPIITHENLVLKVTLMEAEQARLVVEAEVAKAAAREAEERLALVVKTFLPILHAIKESK